MLLKIVEHNRTTIAAIDTLVMSAENICFTQNGNATTISVNSLVSLQLEDISNQVVTYQFHRDNIAQWIPVKKSSILTRIMKKFALLLSLIVGFSSITADTFGKGGSSGGSRGGGFSSSRSSSGSSFSSKPSYSAPSTPAPKVSTPSSGFSSSKTTTPSASSPSTSTSTNKALANTKATAAVAPTKSRQDYVTDFKAANASKYPTKFTSEPVSRPSYIPQTYNGLPVTYNPTMGGYGYNNSLGQFILYDALTDIATASYFSQPRAIAAPVAVTSHSGSFGWGWIFALIALGVGLVAVYFVTR